MGHPCGCQSCAHQTKRGRTHHSARFVPSCLPPACPAPLSPLAPRALFFFFPKIKVSPLFYPKSKLGFSIPSPCQLWSIPSPRVLPVPSIPIPPHCAAVAPCCFFSPFSPFFSPFSLFFSPPALQQGPVASAQERLRGEFVALAALSIVFPLTPSCPGIWVPREVPSGAGGGHFWGQMELFWGTDGAVPPTQPHYLGLGSHRVPQAHPMPLGGHQQGFCTFPSSSTHGCPRGAGFWPLSLPFIHQSEPQAPPGRVLLRTPLQER